MGSRNQRLVPSFHELVRFVSRDLDRPITPYSLARFANLDGSGPDPPCRLMHCRRRSPSSGASAHTRPQRASPIIPCKPAMFSGSAPFPVLLVRGFVPGEGTTPKGRAKGGSGLAVVSIIFAPTRPWFKNCCWGACVNTKWDTAEVMRSVSVEPPAAGCRR